MVAKTRFSVAPDDGIGCLVGTGPVSIPVIVDHKAALLSIQEIVPTIKDIYAYLAIDDLSTLPTTTPDNAAGIINLDALRSFFPAPFLCNAIFLILAGRAAQEEFVNIHNKDKDFNKEEVNAHIELFFFWCLGVHQGKVAKTRFSVAPDNGKLNIWSAHLYHAHIMPSVKAAVSLPAFTMDTANILQYLAVGISCTSKEAEHQNKIHCKQLDYM